MTSSIRHYSYATMELDGEIIHLGDMTIPTSIQVAGERVYKQVPIPVSTTIKLFDTSADLITDFDYMWIASDYDVMIEFVTDSGAAIGIEQYTHKLKGTQRVNQFGAPMVLTSDVSYANYTINFGGGTLDNIDIVRAKNLSASQIARVVFLAVT